jgi:hypothetical protein
MRTFITILSLLLLTNLSAQDQLDKGDVIQLSGVLVSGDSLQAVSYANVYNLSLHKGHITSYSGFFSFPAHPGDSLVFTSIGYKTSVYKLPDTLNLSSYSLIHIIEPDTVKLDELTIKPWPTYDQFKKVFKEIEVPKSDLDRAQDNLDKIAQIDPNISQTPDASLSYKFQMKEYQSKLYYIGQIPPNNLLNPGAWAEFISSWRNGDFKE